MKMMFAVFMAVIAMLFTSTLAGKVYQVGDDNGWTNIGHYDYKAWAASKLFKVGDTIIFRYNKEFHNVVRVSYADYIKCNGDNGYSTQISGNDSFPIKYPGHYFFICTIPDHCQSGQKVDIRVPGIPASNSGHSAPPTTTPTPATAPIQPLPFPYPPPSVPSPSPVKYPATPSPVSPAPAKIPVTPSPEKSPVAPVPAKIPVGPSPAKAPASPNVPPPTQSPDPSMPGDAPDDTEAPEVALTAHKSPASQLESGLKIWLMLMMVLFYVF